jgi:hypothetical protein
MTNRSSSVRNILGALAAVAILAGCSNGGTQSALGPTGPIRQNNGQMRPKSQSLSRLAPFLLRNGDTIIAHPDHSRSWMAPDAKTNDLLYISDLSTDDVYVFTYPRGKLVGTLTGFNQPLGECRDKAGDVFINNLIGANIFEYAHGGTNPIATLNDPGVYPFGCSVDPTSGNLAVAGASSPPGGVAIYLNATGSPTIYTDPNFSSTDYCGYDNKGNLFVDGITSGGAFAFAELRKGKSTFTDISLNQTIVTAGGVQWDGTHVAVEDYNAQVIYEFSVSGSSGTLEGSTPLTGSSGVVQFWIQHLPGFVPKVIGPDEASGNVLLWHYPAGGTVVKTVVGAPVPIGSTVSLAK